MGLRLPLAWQAAATNSRFLARAGAGDSPRGWREARKKLSEGQEPTAVAAHAPPVADLFGNVVADWLKRDQRGNRSHDEVKRILDRDVLPAWRHQLIATIPSDLGTH
jgi:hypothetical protein